jgi:hypothetical protein
VKKTSRREFIITSAAAVAFSATIFRAAQGLLTEGGQYLGLGLSRPIGKAPLAPASVEIDSVAHTLNRLTFGPVAGDYERVAKIGVPAFIEEQLSPAQLHALQTCGASRWVSITRRMTTRSHRFSVASRRCVRFTVGVSFLK